MIQEHIVDIILAALIVLITVKYYRQGLMGTILKLGSYILAFIAASFLCESVTDWIYSNTKLFAGMERYFAKLIVFIFLYLIVKWVFSWIISLLNSIKKLPVIKQTNKLLGAVLGLVCSLVVTVVLCVALQLSSQLVYNAKYVNAIDSSVIVQTVISNEKVAENIETLNGLGGV